MRGLKSEGHRQNFRGSAGCMVIVQSTVSERGGTLARVSLYTGTA